MISVTPYLDQSHIGEYQNKLMELYQADTAINHLVPGSIRSSLEWLLRYVNCYYSNKIEGNFTHPKELLKLEVDDSDYNLSSKSKPVVELLAHLELQLKLKNNSVAEGDVCKQDFIRSLHRSFYEGWPEEYRVVRGRDGSVVLDQESSPIMVAPGEYRSIDVKVGDHIAPSYKEVRAYMSWIESSFNLKNIHGTNRLMAAAALHHRVAWVHPFADGNGRVIRLLTDCYMRFSGLGGYGLWSITRGFGRDPSSYYNALAMADRARQGSSDGRGILSDSGLRFFIEYFIDTALDQVRYFSGLLEPKSLRIRIDFYFEMRAKGAISDSNGKTLPVLKIVAREIYKVLLDRGVMSKSEICGYLNKSEQTLRSTFKQMHDEKLIDIKSKDHVELKLSPAAIEFMFPHLW